MLRESRVLAVGVGLVLLWIAIALLAPWLAPFNPNESLLPMAMPAVRKHQASSVQGRTQRAQAASIRPSISAATANEKAIEKPT